MFHRNQKVVFQNFIIEPTGDKYILYKEYISGISQRCSSKDTLDQEEEEEIELESTDQSWSIGKLINDIQSFKKDTFANVYKRYHSKKDLQTLFENAHKVLVTNKSIAEGVDFKQLEDVMGAKYLFFVFSRSVKLRNLALLSLYTFLKKSTN